MANENKNKTQFGQIKTMQHDLERVKNPSRSLATKEVAPLPDQINSTPPNKVDRPEQPIPSTSENQQEIDLELEDPKLEKLFEPEETASSPDSTTSKIEVTDQIKKEPSVDIAEAVSTLRQNLPNDTAGPIEARETKNDLGTEIGDSLAKLKGFGSEMESEDDNSASVGSQAASIGQSKPTASSPTPPPSSPRPQNPYSRINDIRTKEARDPFNMDETASVSSGGKQKSVILIALLVVLVVVLGGGGYWFFFGNQGESNPTDNTLTQSEETTDSISQDEIDTLVDPLQPDTIIQVTPTANIRADIISAVRSLPDQTELVEIDLIDDSQNKVTFDQIQSQLTITVPTQISENLSEYMLVAVNDNGRYELGVVLELQDDLAESYLQTWQDTAIQDLSPFRLSQETPTAPSDASLQEVEITQITTGEVFTNYFYNYYEQGQSTDITAKDNIILIGTTQGTMNYLIQNVFIQ